MFGIFSFIKNLFYRHVFYRYIFMENKQGFHNKVVLISEINEEHL